MAKPEKLHYSEAGQGTPLVLLHGFPLSSAIWHKQQQRLSDDFRVIVPDLRGHGESPAPCGVYEMSSLAGDVLTLLDSLDIEKAMIMGHSMGGYVVLAAWKQAPHRFLALGLIDSQASADSEGGRQGRYSMAAKVAAEGSRVVAEAMLPKLFVPHLPVGSSIVSQVRQMIFNTPPAGIIGALQGMAVRSDSTAMLSTINVPVLILTGDKDQLILPANAHAMANAISMATLTVVENAGHMPMLEQPEATTMAIRNFSSAIAGVTLSAS